MTDISEVVKGDAPFEFALVHPVTKEELDVKITVVGMDSEVYRKTSHHQRSRRLKSIRPNGKSSGINMEELEADGIELLAACTTGWKNMSYRGSELPFSKENAVMVYKEQAWVREQVDEAIGDRANFSGESSKGS